MYQYNTERRCTVVAWDRSKQPFYLINSVFDSEALMDWFRQWILHFGGIHNPEYEYVNKLILKFSSLNCRVYMIHQLQNNLFNTLSIDEIDTLQDFKQGAEAINNRLQILLDKCLHITPDEYHYQTDKDIKLRIAKYINIVFNRETDYSDIIKICNCIDIWVKRFDVNCRLK